MENGGEGKSRMTSRFPLGATGQMAKLFAETGTRGKNRFRAGGDISRFSLKHVQ